MTGASSPVVVESGDVATTVIAALGLAFALAALAWQAWSFRQAGSRVRVEIRSGLMGRGGMVTTPGAATTQQLEQLRAQGYETPVIAVRVMNSGRGATSVASVGVIYEGGAAFENQAAMDPPLPYRLEGEHEETWRFDGGQVTAYARALASTQLGGQTIRGQVKIGGRDKAVASANMIRLSG